MLVLEETKEEEGDRRVLFVVDLLGNVLDVDLDSGTDLVRGAEEDEGRSHTDKDK